MRFKASILNINRFSQLTASLASLGKDVWLQLNNDQLRFTVVPDRGSQVWAVLAIDSIFETYTIQSAVENNTINLRVPLQPLLRALRSATNAASASIRLTKKDDIPLLSLTIIINNLTRPPTSINVTSHNSDNASAPVNTNANDDSFAEPDGQAFFSHNRETMITQDVPVVVLAPATVASIHEPQCPQPDVHIMLPPLLQLKAISERFTKLALSTSPAAARGHSSEASASQSRLIISANAHGVLRIGVETPALKIESKWDGLTNPELDPNHVEGGEEGIRGHASTRMKEKEGEDAWSTVRVEGRDWGRVLGVGRLGGRVIACFCHEHALILYVYLSTDDAESVLTLEIRDIHKISMKRYIDYPSLPVPPQADPLAELISSINKILSVSPPQQSYSHQSCHGLYSGPTSLAYLFHNLAKSHPDLRIDQKPPEALCAAYLRGKRRTNGPVDPKHCGIANERLAYLAVSAIHRGEAAPVEEFLTQIPAILSSSPAAATSNEWLYGRAGTLYLLRLIHHSHPYYHAKITTATNALIEQILAEGPPWYWHGKDYLGAAHGTVGILTQVILSNPEVVPRVAGVLEEVLEKQDAGTGNWPPSAGSHSAPERLVQFCHGAPGFVISLVAIRSHVARAASTAAKESDGSSLAILLDKIDLAIKRGRECIAQRGLLTKEPNLCHGAVGNAMAFAPDDEKRDEFMRWCQGSVIQMGITEGWFRVEDDETGLFCGEAGRTWGWGVELERKLQSERGSGGRGVIGYTDV
ncbi:Checkpoint protein hus1 [Lecanora helva]